MVGDAYSQVSRDWQSRTADGAGALRTLVVARNCVLFLVQRYVMRRRKQQRRAARVQLVYYLCIKFVDT